MEVEEHEAVEHHSQVIDNLWSPSRTVKEWVPTCEDGLVPSEGLTFDNLEQCETFYKTYAHNVGFSVRRSSSKRNNEGVEIYKYYVCSQEGYQINSTSAKTRGKEKVRKRKWTRVGCKALAGFKRTIDGKYRLYRFYEGHVHLLDNPKKHHVLKSNSKDKSVHKSLVKSFSRANGGLSRTNSIMKEQIGNVEHVECSKHALEFFERDLKTYIKDTDAHMFVENLKRKKVLNKSFYYAYELDEEQRLKHVFWADDISRRNYALYGDVLSFDTIYETNKYKMMFASFTGLDNHRLCVSFGCALLGDENSESFVWLFEKFLEAMGSYKPVCVISDRGLAMKLAIQKVFNTSTHKFCIWHIMSRLSEKVGRSLMSNIDFNTRFKSCVYDSETVVEFETTWHIVMEDFGLTNNEWMSQLFAIRDKWIPAYYRDLFLGGVLRTSSRSESEKTFFNNFTNPHMSLVEFWVRFVSAIELQRHAHSRADFETFSSRPQLKTNRDLEKHVAEIYTCSNFFRFQDELWIACMDCDVDDKKEIEEGFLINIADSSKSDGKTRQVIYNPLNHVAHCSCKMFESEGIPCCHILCILKARLHELPVSFILNRWTKNPTKKTIFDVDSNVSKGCAQLTHEDELIYEIWTEFLTCMEVVGRDSNMLSLALKGISCVKKQVMELKGGTSEGGVQELGPRNGSSASKQVIILPSEQSETKRT